MRQVWAKASISRCSRYGVAVDTRSAFESTPAGAHACVLNRRLLLRAYPRGKIPGTIHKDAQKHLGMLCPAVLCALAEKRFLYAAGPSTSCSGGSEQDLSCLPAPGPRNCGRCRRKATSKTWGSDSQDHSPECAVRLLSRCPASGIEIPTSIGVR